MMSSLAASKEGHWYVHLKTARTKLFGLFGDPRSLACVTDVIEPRVKGGKFGFPASDTERLLSSRCGELAQETTHL